MGDNTDKVTDNLSKGKRVEYKKFKAAYAWASKKEQQRMRELQPGYADRAERDK